MAKLYMMIGDTENRTLYGQRIEVTEIINLISMKDIEDELNEVNESHDDFAAFNVATGRITRDLLLNKDVIYDAPNLTIKDRRAFIRGVSRKMIIPFEVVAVVCDTPKMEAPTKHEGFEEIWYYDGKKWSQK